MEQRGLAIRVQNKLQMIMREQQEAESFECFNDLLIINRIVPKLPCESLREMIRFLKPTFDEPCPTPEDINLLPIYRILAEAPVHDNLLHDFLTSSGYPTATSPLTPTTPIVAATVTTL